MEDRPLKVGLLTTEYHGYSARGGIGSYTRQVAAALLEGGHEPVVLLCNCGAERSLDGGVPVYGVKTSGWGAGLPFPIGRGNSLLLARKLAKLIRQLNLDIIEAPEFGGLTAFLDAPRDKKPCTVVRLHTCSALVRLANDTAPRSLQERILNSIIDCLERRAISKADAVTSISNATSAATRKTLQLSRDDFVIIPNPVAEVFFTSGACRRPETDGPVILLFVGRLEWRKGPDLLVRAFPDVLRKFPAARLCLVGGDTSTAPGNTSMLSYLRSLAPGHVLSRIDFVGPLRPEAVAEKYRLSSVCVFPSRWEGFGIVCAEAMACGKPVIVPSNSGMAEHITHLGNAMLAPENDPAALANAVGDVLSNPNLSASIGAAAQQYAREHFHASAVARLTTRVYRETLACRERSDPYEG